MVGRWAVDGRPTTYQPPKILSCCGGFHVIFFIHIRCFLCYDHKMLYKLKYKSRKFKYPVTCILLLKTAEILCNLEILVQEREFNEYLRNQLDSLKTRRYTGNIVWLLIQESQFTSRKSKFAVCIRQTRVEIFPCNCIALKCHLFCSFQLADAVVSKKIRSL